MESDKKLRETIAENLSKVIRRERKYRGGGLSREKFAWKAGVSSSWIESAELGKIDNPRMLSLIKLSKAHDIDFHEMIREIYP